MRGLLLGALLLGGFSYADEKLSGEQVQMIMGRMAPMFTTLTVCVSGVCSAAYECGLPPNFIKRPDGSIRVFTDCESIVYECNNGVRLNTAGDWCRVDYSNGTYIRMTLLKDEFKIEGLK